MFKKLLAILLLLSLTAAFCSASLAEDMVKIGGRSLLKVVRYRCSLPDGRLVFSGSEGNGLDYNRETARLLCLNPDGTVSWEYVDWDERTYEDAVILEDGNIAACGTVKAVIFTPEGKNTGREIMLTGEDERLSLVLPGGLLTSHSREEDRYMEYIDWDGNVLFRTDGAFYTALPDDDGLVMTGRDPGLGRFFADAKILKTDWQGNLLWEDIPSSLTEDRGEAMDVSDLYGCFRTSDGGYLAIQKQYAKDYDHPNEYHEWRDYTVLMKYSADGQVLWTLQPGTGRLFDEVVEYEGKYCVSYCSGGDLPANISYLWLDADGKELGMTRRSISRQDIPGLEYCLWTRMMTREMVPSKDGLWQNITFWNEDIHSEEKTYNSMQQMLMRIPEL